MSHFFTLVLLDPEQKEDVQESVGKLLDPYDENKEVPEYERPCDCVGAEARDRARLAADEKFGTMDDLRANFWEGREKKIDDDSVDSEWRRHIAPYCEFERQVFEADPDKDSPTATCGFYTEKFCPHGNEPGTRYEDGSGCAGSGVQTSTYNPRSKWDWWQIGGRWDGALMNQNRRPVNMPAPGYNEHRNVRPVVELPPDFSCFAIVTPDGQWHERGSMGWWGCVSDERPKDEWLGRIRELLASHRDCVAVVVDCHI